MADDKKSKLRPVVLRVSVETAREIIAKKLNPGIAASVGDGDAIDMALELIRRDAEGS